MEAVHTANDVKAMEVNELIASLEKKLGRQLSPGAQLLLALAHGASRAESSVCAVSLESGEVKEESLDYQELAGILNGPDMEPMKPYDGPKIIIANPGHFTRLMLFALEHSTNSCGAERLRDENLPHKSSIESLTENLRFLAQMAKEYEKTGYHFAVYPDGEHCLYFRCYDAETNLVFDGGIVLQQQWQGNEPLYNERMKWSIHT
ncbi:MAG: hypothetical protein HY619_05050 [Thaumarchaeota archaeon]|nr:hypothetical protein [Nitrososphaerota archaeon]